MEENPASLSTMKRSLATPSKPEENSASMSTLEENLASPSKREGDPTSLSTVKENVLTPLKPEEKTTSLKRRSITLDVKRQIVVLLENKAKSQADIAREFGLSKSTVCDIWMKREKYKASVQFAANMKKMRRSSFEAIDEGLFLWLQQARSIGAPISGAILKEKAASLAHELGYRDFKCSDGWLGRFKRRRAIFLRFMDVETDPVPQEPTASSPENIEIPIEVKVEPADINYGQSDNESSADEIPPEPSPSAYQASMALMILHRFIEQNACDPAETQVLMTCLGRIDSYVAKTAQTNGLQGEMTDYLNSR